MSNAAEAVQTISGLLFLLCIILISLGVTVIPWAIGIAKMVEWILT